MYYIPNKLFYMAIPKTGSTAITRHLSEVFNHSGETFILKNKVKMSHPTIWDVDVSKAKESFFCTIVRNPYSRFVSHYFYSLYVVECWEKYQSTPFGKMIIDKWKDTSLSSKKIKELEDFKKNHPDRIGILNNLYLDEPTEEYKFLKEILVGIETFSDYVHNFYDKDLVESFFLRQLCFTSFSWNYDGPKMNFIGKMEDLQGSCDYICKKLNIDFKKLPYVNKSSHKHWSEYYNHDTKKLVGSMYDMDFKYFGYEK